MCTPGKLSQYSKVVIARAHFQKELLSFGKNMVLGLIRRVAKPGHPCSSCLLFLTLGDCWLIEVRGSVDFGNEYCDCYCPQSRSDFKLQKKGKEAKKN